MIVTVVYDRLQSVRGTLRRRQWPTVNSEGQIMHRVGLNMNVIVHMHAFHHEIRF